MYVTTMSCPEASILYPPDLTVSPFPVLQCSVSLMCVGGWEIKVPSTGEHSWLLIVIISNH